MVFSAIHPGVKCMTPVIRTVTSRGPTKEDAASAVGQCTWGEENPRQRPLVSWPSRGEKNPWELHVLDAYLPCFWLEFRAGFWGVDLTLQKQRAPLRFSGRWWFKMFFFFWIWQAETWGSELAWNYLEPALSGFLKGAKKREVSNREPEGEVNSENCSGVRIWAWSSSTSFVLKPHFYVFTGGKNALFFLFGFRGFSQQLWVQMFEGDATFPGNKALQNVFINHHDPWRIP